MRPICSPNSGGTASGIAMPERHFAGLARSRGDEYAIVRNLFDAPGRSAENHRVAGAALEDHLLIQFPYTRAFLLACDEDGI